MPFITLATAAGAVRPDRRDELLHAIRAAVAAAESPDMRLDSVGIQWDELERDRLVGPDVVVAVKAIAESTTSEQRRRMLADVSEAVVAIVGEERRRGVWVSVEEIVHHDEWYAGGQPITYTVLERQRAGAEDPFDVGATG
jgi:phenylpyruvate tautomerase PptA (4-oxalocrotonate tautomerase family)